MTAVHIEPSSEPRSQRPLVSRGAAFDPIFGFLCGTAATVLLATLTGVMISLVIGGWPAFAKFGLSFFTSTHWNPVTEVYGGAGPIVGTLITALVALILVFGPVSGAHFNPAVSLALAASRRHAWADLPGYVAAQLAGAVAGVWAAHAMFGEPLLQVSAKMRPGAALMFSEVVATFGLLLTILGCLRHRPAAVPYAVALYIVAAYWVTASTSFANPAVTLARSLSNTFAGIRPQDAPGFIGAQLVGAALATALDAWFHQSEAPPANADAVSARP